MPLLHIQGVPGADFVDENGQLYETPMVDGSDGPEPGGEPRPTGRYDPGLLRLAQQQAGQYESEMAAKRAEPDPAQATWEALQRQIGGTAPYPYGNTPSTALPTSGADPYGEFKAAFQKDYGRAITQEEMNDNGTLVKLGISNELFTLLPLDRQMAFDSSRLA